jgi:hypothetical protein
MERKLHKQNALSLKAKMELLQTTDECSRSKTGICKKKLGIPTSVLCTNIKNLDKVVKITKLAV